MDKKLMTTKLEDGTLRISASHLLELNKNLAGLSAAELIRWSHEVFGRRLALLSAFQEAGCVLCHMVADLGLQDSVDILFVDTGVNFPETLETIESIRNEYGLNIRTLKPALAMAEQTEKLGVLYLSQDGQKRCCHMRKTEPLLATKGEYDGILASLRREEGGTRAAVAPLVIDQQLNALRVHPLLAMTNVEMDEYIAKHKVIINPLHAQGYPTISCNRCTTPVLPGEDERAGRWRHLENAAKYCGINPTDRKRGAAEEYIELPKAVADKVLDFVI